MMAWVQDKARRLALAAGVAFVVGAPTLACMGGEVEVTDAVTDGGSTDGGGGTDAKDPKSLIVGTFQMLPPEEELRKLKVINAAINGKGDAKAKLGKLTKEEEALFKEWEGKKGPEVKGMRSQIKFMRGTQFTFTDSQVTVQFGDEKFGPVSYEVVTATDSRTVVKFDPGLGNGMETHDITWKSADRGIDNITGAESGSFIPLEVRRK
jgi:hypothetical protein